MSVSDEQLGAYLDGELAPDERASVEHAIAADVTLRQRLDALRRLNGRLRQAYDPVAGEPLPDRLRALLENAGAVPRDATPPARAAGVVPFTRPSRRQRLASWSWPEWSAIAASLLVGVLGAWVAQRPSAVPLVAQGRALVAGGQLARALDEQRAGQPGAYTVAFTFQRRDGVLCRSFRGGDRAPVAGFACRDDGTWRVQMLVPGAAGATGDYRQAGTALPASLLRAIDDEIGGEALDAAQEERARANGWRLR